MTFYFPPRRTFLEVDDGIRRDLRDAVHSLLELIEQLDPAAEYEWPDGPEIRAGSLKPKKRSSQLSLF